MSGWYKEEQVTEMQQCAGMNAEIHSCQSFVLGGIQQLAHVVFKGIVLRQKSEF